MLSGFRHEKNIIASMVRVCGIIKSNTKRQTHKLCKETPILHKLKYDFSTNTLNIYCTNKMKSVSWNKDNICSSLKFNFFYVLGKFYLVWRSEKENGVACCLIIPLLVASAVSCNTASQQQWAKAGSLMDRWVAFYKHRWQCLVWW